MLFYGVLQEVTRCISLELLHHCWKRSCEKKEAAAGRVAVRVLLACGSASLITTRNGPHDAIRIKEASLHRVVFPRLALRDSLISIPVTVAELRHLGRPAQHCSSAASIEVCLHTTANLDDQRLKSVKSRKPQTSEQDRLTSLEQLSQTVPPLVL